jgi:hypothetical protein
VARDATVRILTAYLAPDRKRDHRDELRARLTLAEVLFQETKTADAKTALDQDRLGKTLAEPLRSAYIEAATLLVDKYAGASGGKERSK